MKACNAKERRFYCDANRAAWEEAAPLHADKNQEALLKKFSESGYSLLHAHSHECIMQVDLREKAVGQLCCNNGIDLLSLMNYGASSGVGFDASPQFIGQAKTLASAAGQGNVEFVITDIYEISPKYDAQFDFIMTSVGVLSWMPDLFLFFNRAAALLKPGGYYFIEEMHPVLLMYENSSANSDPVPTYSYFREQPWKDTDGLDYFNGKPYQALPAYSFQYTMADIIMAGIQNGFTLCHLAEIGKDISGVCAGLAQVEALPPMAMTMLWQKKVPNLSP